MLNYQIPIVLWTQFRKRSEIAEALADIYSTKIQLDVATTHAVAQARKVGLTWEEIGEQLNMTRQSAWQRWRHLDPTEEDE